MRRTVIILYFALLSTAVSAQEILFPASNGYLWGYISANDDWVIPPDFDDALPFSEGLASVRYLGRYGYIDRNGDWIIERQYKDAKPFEEGLACVLSDGLWGYIDKKGDWIIEPKYLMASSFSEGLAVVFIDGTYYYINHKDEIVSPSGFDKALPFSEGLAWISKENANGFIDITGQLILPLPYDDVSSYSEGLAKVSNNGRIGFIDRNGAVVIPLNYSSASHFTNGYASVKTGNKWKYINTSNKKLGTKSFDWAGNFVHGYAVVVINHKYGIIDMEGKYVVEPSYEKIRSAGRSNSIENIINQRVREKYTIWSAKGEFERSIEYEERVANANKQELLSEFVAASIGEMAEKYVDLNDAYLGRYNADMEKFNVYIPGTIPSSLPVPFDDALNFKRTFIEAQIIEPEFRLSGDKFVLTKYNVVIGDQIFTSDQSQEGYYVKYTDPSNFQSPDIYIELDKVYYWQNAPSIKEGTRGLADVDKNIPLLNYKRNNVFALIIGNENYQSYELNNNLTSVKYATTDAEIFAKYATQTLGVPKDNITLLMDASGGQINSAINRISNISKSYNGDAEIILYYAGLGTIDKSSNKPYLLPVDVTGNDLSYAVNLEKSLNKLTQYPHKRVTVILDTHFEGSGKDASLKTGIPGVKIRPKSPFLKGNMVAFNASRGNQTAYAYPEMTHGIFTYYLLKALQEYEGEMTYGEMFEYIKTNVEKTSSRVANEVQVPEMRVSPHLLEEWEEYSIIITPEIGAKASN